MINTHIFKHIRGLFLRWYRKRFHKEWNVVEHGLHFFQEFADIYGDTINDIETAERFFKDFMEQTKGWVIVDFLDTDNWDCVRKIEADKPNGLIWFYWQILSGDSVADMMRQMAFPLGYYGMSLKFDNIRFAKDKRERCFGIIVNGYTIRERNVNGFAKNRGWVIKWVDAKSSFFSINVVREKDGVSQYWRFMNTPISSFWIIPKQLNVHPQDSEKLLYMYGTDKCEKNLKTAFDKTNGIKKLCIEEQRRIIKEIGNDMRTVAENLFKLIMCYHQEEYQYEIKNYDDVCLGDLTKPLKKSIYKGAFEQERINEIPRLANDLSHDSGNPVDIKDIDALYMDIAYFINDFKSVIERKGHKIIIDPSTDKPSPDDYVKHKYKNFCFKEEIDEIVHATDGKISFKVKVRIGMNVDIFGESGEEMLCQDGYIRNSKEEGIEILKVWDRSEVITLLDKLYQKVSAECDAKGYNTNIYLGISFEAKLKREGVPSHLFTENEIEELMRSADDSKSNKLVIDEDGYAQVIQNPGIGVLYPVSQETWCAGNMYVGRESTLSALHDSYVLCMNLWLRYLETGRYMYDDQYLSDDGLDKVIEDVKKYYSKSIE